MEPLSSALIFPETEPLVHDIGKLLFFFNNLSYYLPTESDNTELNSLIPFKGLCSGYAPAPLEDDLDRFLALLQELENSRPEDLARLFSSAKAPIATGQIRDQDESSAGSVLAALQEDADHKAEVVYKEQLWQARLILKLAETLARREKEVQQGLARVMSDEQKIFASLEGLPETEAAKSNTDYSEIGSRQFIPIRLKACAQLFLADSSNSRPDTLVTACPDSANLLLEGYENNWGATPQKLFSLAIPNFFSTEQYLEARNILRNAAEESLKYFENFLRESAEKLAGISFEQKYIDVWGRTIETSCPSPSEKYNKLDFYYFPGTSPDLLFRKIFNLEHVKETKRSTVTTSLLAVLNT
jgi:hypothetical protein